MVHFNKKLQKIIFILLTLTILIASFSFVNATEDQIPSIATLEGEVNEPEEAISESNSSNSNNLYIRDKNVNINYSVSGNAFIIADTVTIDSVINGNVFIMANEVVLTENAYVYTDGFIMAKKVSISGNIYDLYCICDNLNIEDKGYIIRDLYCSAKNIQVNGYVSRDAYISSSSINLPDEVKSIGGNLNYTANQELDFSNKLVGGDINFTKNSSFKLDTLKSILSGLLKTLIYSLVIILIIILAFKKLEDKIFNTFKENFVKSILYGILGLICIPIISFILMITLIGIPIAFALIALYIFIISISSAVISIALGKLIYEKAFKNKDKSSNLKLILLCLVIVAIIYLLSQIPYIGWLIAFIKTILGIGIIISLLKNIKQ